MEFQYLGTAAAEGWPAIFCNCLSCKRARQLGGKNIRTRSQSLVNRDLLLDLPPDTYMHKLQQDLDLTAVKHLVLTHKHMDHFYPQELTVRGSCYSHDMVEEDLHIYCAREVRDFYLTAADWEAEQESRDHMIWHILEPFAEVRADRYTITAIPAHHMSRGNQPYVYMIRDEEGKTLLYLHDSGYYYDEVWEFFAGYFRDLGRAADMVSFDATYCLTDTHNDGHMGIPEILRVKERMISLGVIDDHTVCVANHFTHNCDTWHEDMVSRTEGKLLISYDGMRLTI
ncbi:MAG: hypothetical protein HUJ69_06120 [Lachnospiraceae bacterium]|nr:hypothetical protein [Lachnospiraceae bacterium]